MCDFHFFANALGQRRQKKNQSANLQKAVQFMICDMLKLRYLEMLNNWD